LASFTGFTVFLFVTQFLQLVVGLTPFAAGAWIMPYAGTFALGSLVTPALARRVPKRRLMVGGLFLASAGVLLLTTLDGAAWQLCLFTGLVLLAAGLCPVCVFAPDLVVACASVEHAGAAAALTETSAELGGALGIALLGSLGSAVYRATLTARAASDIPHAALERARGSLVGIAEVTGLLPAAQATALESAAHAAYAGALHAVAVAASALTLASAFLLRRALGRHSRRRAAP
jgi:DHA2 family multidrug resistance protein-like MFS transporter